MAGLHGLRLTEIEWQLADGAAPAALASLTSLAGDGEDLGRLVLIKQGAGRSVFRLDGRAGPLYVKHLWARTWWRALLDVVRGSAAWREWRTAQQIASRGVPAIRALACGRVQRGVLRREHFLVTEGVADAVPLGHYVERPDLELDAADALLVRRGLIAALARLCARAHAAGVDHDDLHLGNVLVRLDARGRPRLTEPDVLLLVDLPKTRVTAPLGWPAARRSLAMLAAATIRVASIGERWRFFLAYCRQRRELELSDRRAAAREVYLAACRRSRLIARSRDKRIWRSNAQFARVRGRAWRAHRAVDFPAELLARLTCDPAAPLGRIDAEPIKLSHTSLVLRDRWTCGGQTWVVAYKRYRPRTWWKRLLAPLRIDRALRGWFAGHALAMRGISVVRPLAAITCRDPNRSRAGYLATEWLEGAVDAHSYLWSLAARPADQRFERACQLADAAGMLVGRMHRLEVKHRDLKACNLAVREGPASLELALFDLDGVRFTRRLSLGGRARDIARLAASCEAHPWLPASAGRRFLSAYVRETWLEPVAAGRLWRLVRRRVGRLKSGRMRRGETPLVAPQCRLVAAPPLGR